MGMGGGAGAYRRETLAARFGDKALPDVLIERSRRASGAEITQGRVALAYVEPPGAAR